MEFDAVILAGGRSSRLGGSPKARLMSGGRTLLELALAAARGAAAVVVVGPDPGALPAGVLTCREEPAFAGPAAAIGAGLGALTAHRAAAGSAGPVPPLTLVLACDMPGVAAAITALREALADGLAADGLLAVSEDGRWQPLAGFYGTAALQRAVAEAGRRDALANASVSALLASLDMRGLRVPPGSTDDVDTWADAAALGVAGRSADLQPDGSGAPRLTPNLEENGEEPG